MPLAVAADQIAAVGINNNKCHIPRQKQSVLEFLMYICMQIANIEQKSVMEEKAYSIIIVLLLLCSRMAVGAVPVILTAGQSNADGRVHIAELPIYANYQYCLWSYGSGDYLKADGQFKPFAPTVGRKDLGDRWGFDAIVYYLLEQYWQQPFYVIKQTMGGTASIPRV